MLSFIVSSNQPDTHDGLYEVLDCPLCKSNQHSQLYQRQKRAGAPLGDVLISVAQCDGCGFVYNNPCVRGDVLDAYYHSSSLASGQTFRDESADGYYPQLNHDRAVYFGRLLASQSQGKLLDIGCGVGGFLDALKTQGLAQWEFYGLEPSENAAASARDKGYIIEESFLGADHLEENSFDAIAMVSVLEHVRDPRLALERLRQLLKPDGIVFIEVPSVLHPELTLTGYFSMEHIQHFSPGILANLFRDMGWVDMMNDPLIEDHGLRLIGSANLSKWEQKNTVSYTDNPAYTRKVIKAYATAELELVEMIIRRVEVALKQWKSEGRKIAIYGAGIHTLELLSVVDLPAYVSIILDSDTKKQGTQFLGLPVHAPKEISNLGIDAVLISSQRFQDEIKRFVESIAPDSIEIAVCYDDPNNSLLSLPQD